MPLGFWGDADGSRFRQSYFEKFPGVWHHGDFVEVTAEGGVVVLGRSDATLKPGGVRIGPAEIYRPLQSISEVVDALAAGKRSGADVQIWLFVVLREGVVLDADLEERLVSTILEGASPSHVPVRIVQVADLPRTRSGKLAEVAVTRLINGDEISNRDQLENPAALNEISRAVARRIA
jgi:acetoacetyl-CoA synthetase